MINEVLDLDSMEYFWYTILKRTDDFWSIKPKDLFNEIQSKEGVK